ncbi:MAG: universal stress protein [Amnibacterium sp.]
MTVHTTEAETELTGFPSEEPEERIVLATDGEAAAISAAHWIAERALRKPLAVTIVHLAGDLHGAGVLEPGPTRAEQVVWEEREYLAELAPDAELRTAVVQGPREQALLATAAGADILVLGSNRSAGRPPLPVPSFSTRVGAAAAVPTVVVPRRWRPLRERVVVAVDEAFDDVAAIDFGAREAALLDTDLVLEHAGSRAPGSRTEDLFPSDDEEWRAAARARLGRLAAEAEHRHPGLHVRTGLRSGPIVQVLREAGDGAALLVLAAHRMTPESHGLLGAVGRGVLDTPPCPIAVVPVQVP